ATVPQDYTNPAGPTFQLAVIRLPARDMARRIGSLFTNPGGPGETGVDFLRAVAPALAALNERFDLVSWDPRGVGASRPAVRPCFTDAEWKRQIAEPALTPQTLDERSWIAEARAHVMQCLKRNPGVLPYLSTGNVARAAIGDLLDPRSWRLLADSLSLARHGDGRLLEFGDLDTGLSADATFDEAGFVIKALDGDWPTSIGLYRRDGRRAFRDLPHF